MTRGRQGRLLLWLGLAAAVAGAAWAVASWQRWHAAERAWLEQVERLEGGGEQYDPRESDARWRLAQRWEGRLDHALLLTAGGVALALLGRGTVWGTRQRRRAPALPPPTGRLLLATWLDAAVAALLGWLLAAGGTPLAAVAVLVAGLLASLLAAGGSPGMVLTGTRALDAGGRPPHPLRAVLATALLPPTLAWLAASSLVQVPLALAGRLRSLRWAAPHLAATGIVAARL